MVDLLNQELRLRDIRKLVVRNLHEVKWERGVDETSEWIIASVKDQEHYQKLISWLCSKNIVGSFNAILVDRAWSEVKNVHWGSFCGKPEQYFCQKDILVVAFDRSWIVEYASSQEIIRFGRWI